jgi:hypothetical protein
VIKRQALTSIPLSGSYSGTEAGSYSNSNCNSSVGPYIDGFNLGVTHVTGTSLTFTFRYDSGISCSLSGALQQQGQLFQIPAASFQCADGLSTSATVSEIKKTAFGIEGTFSASNVGGGCRQDATFSAVSLPPI